MVAGLKNSENEWVPSVDDDEATLTTAVVGIDSAGRALVA
jgi:hypothetical protein